MDADAPAGLPQVLDVFLKQNECLSSGGRERVAPGADHGAGGGFFFGGSVAGLRELVRGCQDCVVRGYRAGPAFRGLFRRELGIREGIEADNEAASRVIR